ncbi:MAG: NADH-quinone oxidoreductase subunit I [Euryarchaeota archaeon]|nr:NADH-quinone oxidoreductase subunit I [Euryarchaeota archaeon]
MRTKSLIAKPMLITLKHLFKKPVTVQYPEEKLTLAERYRGMHAYDLERCIACSACVRICPNKCIELQVSITPEGKKKIEAYNIYIGRCMFCGLCVEACPLKPKVITMTQKYELADYDRPSLVYGIERLRGGRESEP